MEKRWISSLKALPVWMAIASMAFTGCATHYSGRKPDLATHGTQAQAEYAQFRLKERSMLMHGWAFEMGPEETLYSVDSMKPVLASVSPAAMEMLERGECWRSFQLGSALAAVGTLIGAIIADSGTTARSVLVYSSIGMSAASVAFGIVSVSHISKATRRYNQDLRSRLGVEAAELQTGLALSLHY